MYMTLVISNIRRSIFRVAGNFTVREIHVSFTILNFNPSIFRFSATLRTRAF